MATALFRPTHPSHDVPCMLCELDDLPRYAADVDRWAHARIDAHVFAFTCGGSPAQLDHYAWQHMGRDNAADEVAP